MKCSRRRGFFIGFPYLRFAETSGRLPFLCRRYVNWWNDTSTRGFLGTREIRSQSRRCQHLGKRNYNHSFRLPGKLLIHTKKTKQKKNKKKTKKNRPTTEPPTIFGNFSTYWMIMILNFLPIVIFIPSHQRKIHKSKPVSVARDFIVKQWLYSIWRGGRVVKALDC